MGRKKSNIKEEAGRNFLVREKEYYDILRRELEQRKGEDVDITFRQVRKNNGVSMNACTVRYGDAQIAPTVYLDPYYDHYLNGEAVAESAESILRYCRSKTPAVTIPENFFERYDNVPGRLGIKLVCTERNGAFLKEIPHLEMEDMSAIFYYLLEDLTFGNGMIIVRNSDMQRWGKSVEDLYRDALENCPKMLPPVFRPLSDVLDFIRPCGEGELYLLTNESALYGAAVVLYPGILDEIAGEIGAPFFVLPSSVHEMILLPDHGEDPEGLLEIVTEINHTQVAREEILTDAVYHYSRGDSFIRKLV